MKLLSNLKKIISNSNLKCISCDYQPDNPHEKFIVEKELEKLTRYKCPKCETTFTAILCNECDRGYYSLSEINIVKKSPDLEIYKCDCGSKLVESSTLF